MILGFRHIQGKKMLSGTFNHFPVEYDKKIGTKLVLRENLFTNLQKKSTHDDFFSPKSDREDRETSDLITILG